MSSTLKMLLPTTLPSAMSDCPASDACTPTRASGENSRTKNAAQATRRIDSGERSSSTAHMTTAVIRNARWVGTVAPANST